MEFGTGESPVSLDERDPFVLTGEAEAWAEKYLAADGDSLGADSDLIRDVESDGVNHERLEAEVRRLLSTIDVEDGFCAKCRHLLCHWPDLSTTQQDSWRDFGSISEIEAAARAGCKFCAFNFSRLVYAGQLDTFRKIEQRLAVLSLWHDVSTVLSIRGFGPGPVRPVGPHLMWLDFPRRRAPLPAYGGGWGLEFISSVEDPPASLWQGKVNVFEIARIWLNQCLDSHETCRNTHEYKGPTRLLSFERDAAKLVLTETLSILPQYATLSYCWGHEPFTMLTVENMSSLLKGLAISYLPKVFQDAIKVARELGLSYIWIDALCIIQRGDDNKDWLMESGRMRSVYGNSFVNLAASSATNVHQSLFSKPDSYNGGFCARVSTSKYSTVRKFQSLGADKEIVTRSHLATRAWTLQERLLPARTIYVGNTGIFWQCRSGIKSEFLPDGIRSGAGLNSLRLDYKEWNWCEIVAQYSRAHLTNPLDRLPALAGIARHQHEATGHHYLAGLWRERLILDLPWSVLGERRKRPTWRSPSWSWVSVDSQACYHHFGFYSPTGLIGDIREYISVQDAWTTPSGPDPFGQVSSGLLSIKCSALVQAELLDSGRSVETLRGQSSPGLRFVSLRSVAPDFPVSMDVLEDEGGCREVYLLPVFGSFSDGYREPPRKEVEEEKSDTDGEGESQDVVLNNLDKNEVDDRQEGEEDGWDTSAEAAVQDDASNNSDENWAHEGHLQLTGLVLQACGESTDNRGRFSRVGSFNFENFEWSHHVDNAWDRDYYREFIKVLDAQRPERAEAEYLHASSSHDRSKDWISITIE